MLLVRNDGTLWRWGVLTNWNWKTEWPGLHSFTPYRLGTESNWAEVFLVDNQFCLRKADGSLWTLWYPYMSNTRQKIELEPGFAVGRLALLGRNNWRSTTITRIGFEYRLGVYDDGTFRVWADQKFNNQSHSYEWSAVDLQFGNDTNWLAVAGHGHEIVTLRDDGTLWQWDFFHDNRFGWNPVRDEREMLARKPVRLGSHADWIAIAGADGGIISLAADGSLWYWPLESVTYYMARFGGYNGNDNSHFEPLLDISRKPQLLGNVFGKAD
jgi:alpha-tubulin suppressor-like RCC1 family protein